MHTHDDVDYCWCDATISRLCECGEYDRYFGTDLEHQHGEENEKNP